jgi:hypothetical protein
MKTLAIVAVAGALASPALTFAQSSDEPVTRAQVRAELIQLEQVGYNPATADNANYPDRIQAAEAQVSARNDTQLTDSAVGGVPAGTSASGAPEGGAYGGGAPYTAYPSYPAYPSRMSYGSSGCKGPRSFCNLYSGG